MNSTQNIEEEKNMEEVREFAKLISEKHNLTTYAVIIDDTYHILVKEYFDIDKIVDDLVDYCQPYIAANTLVSRDYLDEVDWETRTFTASDCRYYD